ncbi:DNA polymerase I [Pseudoscardovia radai]|uniref:DNA polymerase I n=1 Tax=Pseudoscardovia radai TaxID=987066 RepID=A0A261EUD2_9BIFI|nr:DNA polymerase I [Pseudoscardovia radai]
MALDNKTVRPKGAPRGKGGRNDDGAAVQAVKTVRAVKTGNSNDSAASRRRLLVIDGHSLAFRAYFALPVEGFTSSWGQPTNAIYGFARMLSNVVRDEKPTHIGVAFDMKGGTFRQKMLPQYKGTRDAAPEELLSQLPLIQKMLDAFSIRWIEKPGYEGDDIIGTLAQMGEDAGCDTLVLSGDRDAFQLIDDSVTVLYPGHHFRDLKHMTPQEVLAKYKVTPQQYPDLAAMRGEQADNIPGVPGVGDGYAAKWINQYGGLEQIIEHADEIGGKKGEALRESIDQVRLNRKVNALVRDLDLPVTVDDLAIVPPDRQAVGELFDRLGFSARTRDNFLKPFPAGAPVKKVTLDLSDLGGGESDAPSVDAVEVRTPVIDDVPAAQLPAWLAKHGSAALAPRTAAHGDGATASAVSKSAAKKPAASKSAVKKSAAKPAEPAPVCDPDLALAIDDDAVWALDIDGDPTPGAVHTTRLTIMAPDSHVASVPTADIDEGTARAIGGKIVELSGSLALHGYKEHLHLFSALGLECPEPWIDTKLAAYLESAGSKQDLESVIARVLPTGALPAPEEHAAEPLSLFDDPAADDSAAVTAAARRVTAIVAIAQTLVRELDERRESGLLRDIEYPVSRILARMEDTGAAVDPARMGELYDSFAAGAKQAESAAWDAAGRQINLQSPKQVQEVLFTDMGLQPIGRTKKGGFKTDSDSLTELAIRNASDERASGFITALLRYREINKLKQCVETLQKAVNPSDGLIHTTFEQAVTATGRLSSANPNLQNIPNRNKEGREIRGAFVPADGFVALLSSDYSQVELRIMAHLSGDEALIDAFRSGRDFHRYVASLVYQVPVEQITSDQRSHVKAMSYGLAYGLSTYGLAQQLRISPAEADVLKGKYFATFGKVHDYLESLVADARKKGYTETMFGRRRYIPDLNSKSWQRRDAAERAALNAPIQGSAADIMKIAMIRVDEALRAAKVASRVMLQIHDELVVELAPGEQEQVTALVKDAMEHAVTLSVPLDVSTGVGGDWQLAAH